MQRVRRLRAIVAIAAVGVLAVAGLAGCRSEPNVAAYVGDTRFTEKQINEVVDEVADRVNEGRLGGVRQNVVSWLVLGDLGRRVAAEQQVSIPPVDVVGAAEQAQLPADTKLAKAFAEWVTVGTALLQVAPDSQPSQADLRAIFESLVDQGQVPEGTTFEMVASQLITPDTAKLVGLRNLLSEAAEQHKLAVNPRYRPLNVALGDIPFPLALEASAVSDVR